MYSPTDPRVLSQLTALLDQLDLAEKVQLLSGRDFWNTWPIEKIGLRRILFSDGPSGVRGENWDERDPSLNLPSATALAASWDVAMAARYGAAAAVEARRKGVDVVLGPTVNLHRSPLGGRSFEAFSEDPVLTADLAAAYVEGVQDNGVAATPKHYVGNDYETERFTADTVVSERALRELYLLAFEKTVTEAHAWAIMSAYNSINGVTASENELLETPLNSEWGFDGLVVSDWTGVRSTDAAKASQDLAMPGPFGAWGDALLAAVRSGEVTEDAIDRNVLRILALAARVGALDGFDAVVPTPTTVEDGVAFAREAAAAGTVLVTNRGILPLDPADVRRIAVIGHNATVARTMGGGSATVIPEKIVSPLVGIREAYPDAQVDYAIGAVVQSGVAPLALYDLLNPVTGEAGVRASFIDRTGKEIYTEDRRATALVWFGSGAPISDTETLRLRTGWTASETATVRFGIAAVGRTSVTIDGALLFDETLAAEGDDLGAALLSPGAMSRPLDVVAGRVYDILIEYRREESQLVGAMAFQFGLEAPDEAPEKLIDEAEAIARDADVVILVVGTNSAVESEGFDRANLALPGHQDELASRVLAANPNSVVVVNSGAPVVLPWRDSAAAILLTWFGGQEFGHALGDVLTGDVEPGGHLPTTWPAAEVDVPVLDVTPRDGKLRYDEGIHIGYRAWLKKGVTPAWSFGFGLGYTTWTLNRLEAPSTVDPSGAVTVSATVTNTGVRPGKQVVQVYASRSGSAVDRPVRWLVGFAAVTVAPGGTATVDVVIPARALAHWDTGWQYEAGEFALGVGFAVDDLPLSTTVTVLGAV